MSEVSKQDSGLNHLFIEALTSILHNYQIVRAIRSFTNEIVDYENLFDSNLTRKNDEPNELSDFRLLYTIKKVLGSNHHNEWVSLQDKMIFPLSRDEVLVVPFDGHRHQPLPEQISMILGFDGVGHLVSESVSLRLINRALENLANHHQPFAFGVINIDNYQALVANYDQLGQLDIFDRIFEEIQEKLGLHDVVAPLSDNEFATILFCEEDINDVFPRLWELSSLSNTPLSLGEVQIPIPFSAGYVLVTDACTTAKAILGDAISMMYKSKSNGKNGYHLSNAYHSASDPSL